jgi:NADP-dependent 3-hydroxy acid dehydrogenase YdfG
LVSPVLMLLWTQVFTPHLRTLLTSAVTGWFSGIDATLCKFITEHGHLVVATARKPDTLSYLPDSPKVLKLALDMNSKASVEAALKESLTKFSRIDVLVNHAG